MYGHGKMNGGAPSACMMPVQQEEPSRTHTQTSNTHSVNFHASTDKLKQKERIITVRYGHHQMKLIRKRLAVEEWLDTELKKIYRCHDQDDYDTEIDLDEVLDIGSQPEQIGYLQEKLSNAPQPKEVIDMFIYQVLEKARTL